MDDNKSVEDLINNNGITDEQKDADELSDALKKTGSYILRRIIIAVVVTFIFFIIYYSVM